MDSTGSLVRCPSATSLALNLPSCLTANTKWTLIFWKPSGMTTFPLWNCALPVSLKTLYLTEFRQPLQVQIHLEMPGILVQLGHIQRTYKLAPQIDLKWSPTRSLRRYQAICPFRARDGR